ncbi:MAG: hypothetical protein GX417_09905 [Clostridiales bacterium]|nr:hypothetical protein [Clostridiales bacterium]
MNLEAVAPLNDTLGILGLGMLGIFIVTAAIILVITLLNLLTAPSKKKRQSGGQQ